MKIILRSTINNNFISIFIKSSEPYKNLIDMLNNDLKDPVAGILIINDETISVLELNKIKTVLEKLKIKDLKLYSNSRETILTGKSLKINSCFKIYQRGFEDELFSTPFNKYEDTIHKGTVRSGNRISSNGDLYIIGDVNPGAIISAKNNVYVWGKLLGIALAGKDGNKNASIASLYLKPLQLRISDIVALGPKEKPNNQYPEIAVIENRSIVIKPLMVGPQ